MRFAVIYPLIAAFVILRLIWPAFKTRRTRIALIALLVPGALFPAVARFIGGSMVAPVLPQPVMIIGGLLQNFTFCLFALVLLREAASIPARIAGLPLPWLGRCRPLSAALIVIAAAASIYGTWQATQALAVRDVTIPVRGLDARLEGLTIVQLSDLHVSSAFGRERVERVVEAVNALKPDLIAVTGDFVDGTVPERGEDLRPLSRLSAPLGVWGCEGNHEHYVDYEGWREFLPRLGIRMLFNEHETIDVRGTRMVVAGLTDPMGALRYGREAPDSAKAFAGAPRDAFRLLLLHQPKFAPRVEGRADLILSGHTHGGQVFLLYPVVSKLNNGFVSGLYSIAGGVKVYVNAGTDVWNGFLLRLGTIGEITRITLARAPQAPDAQAEAAAKESP